MKSRIDLVYTNMSQSYEEPDHPSPIGLSKHGTILVQPKPSYQLPSSHKYMVEAKISSKNQRTFFANNIEVNPSKTKELMICFSKNPVFPPLITIDGDEIGRVGQSNLLSIPESPHECLITFILHLHEFHYLCFIRFNYVYT